MASPERTAWAAAWTPWLIVLRALHALRPRRAVRPRRMRESTSRRRRQLRGDCATGGGPMRSKRAGGMTGSEAMRLRATRHRAPAATTAPAPALATPPSPAATPASAGLTGRAPRL